MVSIESDINKFLEYYRANFPSATILPKMHLLEDHMVQWLRRWHLGAGLMGEQGAESIHSHLKRLEATYSTIPNKVDRLKYIFNMYNLEVAPSLQTLRPPIKRKKTENS